jgi:hypothetical protein
MNQAIHELKGLFMFSMASILNVLSIIDRSTITFVLSTISSVLVIGYYTLAIKEKLKTKKQNQDVGKAK